MPDFLVISADLAWPLAVLLAWLAGEFIHRWTRLPRISVYGLVGFLCAQAFPDLFATESGSPVIVLANVAFGLILFELGYRVNLNWLRVNPWVAISGLAESFATFAVVYLIASLWGVPSMTALLLASLAMSTSPAGVLRVVNEERSSGQATERVLHLVALNCVLAVLTFKVIVGFWVFETSGSLTQAISLSAIELVASALLGAVCGMLVPAVLRHLGNLAREGTLAFALVVVILVAITHAYDLSPVLATLAFGLTARHRRVAFTRTQRNFGAIGELLTILLFVFAVSTLSWDNVVSGGMLAFVLLLARFVVKTAGVAAFSKLSGTPWRKGLATGMALAPMSVFVVLLLEQTKNSGVVLVDELAAVAAMTVFMEVLGPIITQRALVWARETKKEE
ncbi:cation:proton antiporter [Pseudoduganella umbonata]|uniref:Kef-type K+ transport system membrane component KefB n=1 Tax=Pseudoduganella umbonata TaxID=864828 RepID=A0A4P8HQ68_9BURK|nr:cation:proton antiporter [Pseudoduganella umbonata]MBB3221535.1 Kef-type K+ transport system membrane component KefB [Pseudoduganella umbonata]QCP10678.1 sodium:proton antiporter [Pseudoduganella umbonata]